jgi:hypothetical protein
VVDSGRNVESFSAETIEGSNDPTFFEIVTPPPQPQRIET